MAYIIDARNSGGDVLVLGKTLVLPKSDDPAVVGAEPVCGSLRFNPTKNIVEAYMPIGNNDWTWEKVGVDNGQSHVMFTTGATMTGDLVMRSGTIYADNGIPTAPSISFDSKRRHGFSIDQTGNIRTSIDGAVLTLLEATKLTVFGDLEAQDAAIRDLSGRDASLRDVSTRDILSRSETTGRLIAVIGEIDRLHANTGNVVALTSNTATIDDLTGNVGFISNFAANEIVVQRPSANASTDYVSEAVFDVNDREWVLSHLGNHDFRFTFDGSEVMNLSPNGTVRAGRFQDLSDPPGLFAADAAYGVGTVLVVGGDSEVTVTSTVAHPAVAGIVRVSDPSKMLRLYENRRALCKVVGPIKKGDVLVTSTVPGCAQAWKPWPAPTRYGVGANRIPPFLSNARSALGRITLDPNTVVQASANAQTYADYGSLGFALDPDRDHASTSSNATTSNLTFGAYRSNAVAMLVPNTQTTANASSDIAPYENFSAISSATSDPYATFYDSLPPSAIVGIALADFNGAQGTIEVRI